MTSTPRNFSEVISIFLNIINDLLPILISVALLVFIWGLVLFINKAGDSKNHAQGSALMRWGIVGLFIMVSFLGIIRFFYNDAEFSRQFPDESGRRHFLPE